MLEKGAIVVREEIYEQYKPKLVNYIRLTEKYKGQDALQETLQLVSRAKKTVPSFDDLFFFGRGN